MPLPPALLARLKKRGIIKQPEPEVEEEVIAEDYDDDTIKVPENDANINESSEVIDNNIANDINEPVPGCPNKWNVYHDCSRFCLEKWGNGKLQSSPKTERKHQKMLKKYPIPEGWQEIYDPGTGRHYYWNTQTGEVAWLPPSHPRCQVSLPAEKLRVFLRETMAVAMDEEQELSASDDDESDEEAEAIAKENEKKERHRYRDRFKSKRRTRMREDDLDPMDPAAYSETPRGTWATGLERKGEAKTGADVTASGPLYQMRPYPSPGAVLRMNAELRKEKDGKSEDEDSDET